MTNLRAPALRLAGAGLLALGLASLAVPHATLEAAKPRPCATIADGTLHDTLGNPLQLGFDQFGYNYQAHEFNGTSTASIGSWMEWTLDRPATTWTIASG